MQMSGEYMIPLPRDTVWSAINDVALLHAIIPRCESLTRLSASEIEAVVVARIGPFKTTFKGLITLHDMNPPHSYRMEGVGQGGLAGFAKGGAKVRLAEVPGGTMLFYEIEAHVGGKLGHLGGKLVDSAAHRWADKFLTRFAEKAAEAADVTPPTPDPPKRGWNIFS